MNLTKAQEELLDDLRRGWEVTMVEEHYTLVKGDKVGSRIWPSTFSGLFDIGYVERTEAGSYRISQKGMARE